MNVDKNGYLRGKVKHSDLIHRQIAYEHIYCKDRKKYPLRFSEYQVHHIDENKQNNDISNLMLLTKEDHEKIHQLGISKKVKTTIHIHNDEYQRWETKKRLSNRQPFSNLWLLVGDKGTVIIKESMKWGLIVWAVIGIIAGIVEGVWDTRVMALIIISGLGFVVLVLALLALGVLTVSGWFYKHSKDSKERFKKAFKK